MEQYRLLAEYLLPAHMLDWFDLKNVRVEKKGETQVLHLYLDENEQKPDEREYLRPNGFTRESVFHDFPIRGQEVLPIQANKDLCLIHTLLRVTRIKSKRSIYF